jgi:hypothetical protein
MDVDSLIRNARALWRAEKIIADIQLQNLAVRLGLQAFAALIAIFGLLMLELAAFWALRDMWSEIKAAVVLAVANFALALILMMIAVWRKPGRELDVAREVQTTAIQSLQADARALHGDVASFANAVKHPFETVVPAAIIPLVTLLIQYLRQRKPNAGRE